MNFSREKSIRVLSLSLVGELGFDKKLKSIWMRYPVPASLEKGEPNGITIGANSALAF